MKKLIVLILMMLVSCMMYAGRNDLGPATLKKEVKPLGPVPETVPCEFKDKDPVTGELVWVPGIIWADRENHLLCWGIETKEDGPDKDKGKGNDKERVLKGSITVGYAGLAPSLSASWVLKERQHGVHLLPSMFDKINEYVALKKPIKVNAKDQGLLLGMVCPYPDKGESWMDTKFVSLRVWFRWTTKTVDFDQVRKEGEPRTYMRIAWKDSEKLRSLYTSIPEKINGLTQAEFDEQKLQKRREQNKKP
jgi:hypothetical protein